MSEIVSVHSVPRYWVSTGHSFWEKAFDSPPFCSCTMEEYIKVEG
jgi:hypothetical protein